MNLGFPQIIVLFYYAWNVGTAFRNAGYNYKAYVNPWVSLLNAAWWIFILYMGGFFDRKKR